MKIVRFHRAAEAEMREAAAWYEAQQPGLGSRFLVTVQDAVNRIVINPALYPVVDSDVRRCLTKTFPFGVLFRDLPQHVVIMAVMDLRRDPDYWKNR